MSRWRDVEVELAGISGTCQPDDDAPAVKGVAAPPGCKSTIISWAQVPYPMVARVCVTNYVVKPARFAAVQNYNSLGGR